MTCSSKCLHPKHFFIFLIWYHIYYRCTQQRLMRQRWGLLTCIFINLFSNVVRFQMKNCGVGTSCYSIMVYPLDSVPTLTLKLTLQYIIMSDGVLHEVPTILWSRLCLNRTNRKDRRVRLRTSSRTIDEDALKPKSDHDPKPKAKPNTETNTKPNPRKRN